MADEEVAGLPKGGPSFRLSHTITFESSCCGLGVFYFGIKLISAFEVYVGLLRNPAMKKVQECFSLCCDRES